MLTYSLSKFDEDFTNSLWVLSAQTSLNLTSGKVSRTESSSTDENSSTNIKQNKKRFSNDEKFSTFEMFSTVDLDRP